MGWHGWLGDDRQPSTGQKTHLPGWRTIVAGRTDAAGWHHTKETSLTQATVRRATGTFGLISAILFLLQAPLYFVYSGAPPDWNILTRILLSFLGCMAFLAFLAGLRQVVGQANPAYEWVATLALAAGLLYTAVVLVSQSMEGGATIASAAPIDPTVDGPLAPGQWLMYGSVGRLLTALFAAAAGFAILRTRALPAWAGRLAYALAAINLAFVPSLFFGADAAQFYSAVGWGTTAVAASFLSYWIAAVSIVLVQRPQHPHTPELATSARPAARPQKP